ncbi:MAG: putative DNA-binding domain-containing protein [Aquabacterium sp.]
MTLPSADLQREALRQQMLLRALLGDARPGVVEGWLRDTPARKRRGLQAYQANAGALAERALVAAYPTVQPLLGEASFAALARAFWQAQPPLLGDVATWGDGLPVFIVAAEQLASEPYLADVARLDWAVHQAEQAADDDNAADGLDRLSQADPATLRLRLRAGHAVLASVHPVHAIWQAHRSDEPDRFAAVRQAFAEQRAEAVRVRRDGFKVAVDAISVHDAAFEAAVLQGRTLGEALALTAEAAGEFDFEIWFIDTLRRHGLAAAQSS